MNTLDILRQTGRTTRMLEEAIRLQAEGKLVIVVMANNKHAHLARVRTKHKVNVISASYGEWAWPVMRLKGSPADTVYLIDHYAIEQEYPHILKILHQFDA